MHIPLFDSRLAGRVAAIVSVAFLVGACGSSTPTTQGGATAPGVTATSIKIGTSTPVTGPVGAVCVPINNGAQAVFASVNAKGGINGRKIDSEVLDDAYQADRAVANAKQFINEPVFAVYGGCGSIGAGAIYQPLAAAKVPFVFPTGTLPGLYDPVQKYVFALNPGYDVQLRAAIKGVLASMGAGKVYLVNQVLPDYQTLSDTVKKATTDAGGSFIGESTITAGSTDYTPVALNVKAAAPDYVVINAASAQTAATINALSVQHALPKRQIISDQNAANQIFKAAVKDPTALNMVSAVWGWELPSSAAAGECKSIFAQYGKAGYTPVDTDYLACGSAQMTVAALTKAGQNLTRDGFIKALESFKKQKFGVLPPVTMSGTKHLAVDEQYVGHWADGAPVITGTASIS